MKFLNLMMLMGMMALSHAAFAVDTPDKFEGCKVVTASEAQALMGKGTKLFDVRVATEYAEEHIKGAVSVPYAEKSKKEVAFDSALDSFDDTKIPASNMIFQCNGIECWKSLKACKWANKKGKKDVYWFRGGIPEWKAKNLPTEK